ncbi:MAG: hypothetical protein AABX38_06750 [Candidatus Micrarchaeota archaeon]
MVNIKTHIERAKIPSSNLNHILKLGYVCPQIEHIASSFKDLSKEIGPLRLMLAVGYGIIFDPSGLWPSATFAKAFRYFKARNLRTEGLRSFARSLQRESDYSNMFALSLACPEVLDENLKQALVAKEYSVRTDFVLPNRSSAGDIIADARLTSSYLTIGTPSLVDPEMISSYVSLLNVFLRAELRHRSLLDNSSKRTDTNKVEVDRLTKICKKLFGDSFNVPWSCMPEKAVRLNFELSRDTLHQTLKLASSLFANLLIQGYAISFKYTIPDLKIPGRFGFRLMAYVPSAALSLYLEILKANGLDEQKMHHDYENTVEPTTGVMLPGYVHLRTSGEDGTSYLQGTELVRAVSSNFTSYVIASLNRFHQDDDSIVSLLDGEKVDLVRLVS